MTTRFIHLVDYAKTPSLRECLSFLHSKCEKFTLVTRDETDCGVMNMLATFRLEMRRTDSWPGTTLLLGHTKWIHAYRFTNGSAAVLWNNVRTFWSMRHPKQPEDFVAYRADGCPLFITIAHEGAAYFECEVNEERALRDELVKHHFPLFDSEILEGVTP